MQKSRDYKYSVANTIRYRLDQESHQASSSYKIEFKKVENQNFIVELSRNNFKINGKEITAKFAKIAHEYTTALFPVQFQIDNYSASLYNFNNISERVKIKDTELNLRYQGEGINYIRNSFLEKTIKSSDAMANYFSTLGLIRVILFCIQNLENNEQHQCKWLVNTLNFATWWTGTKTYNLDSNTLKYQGEITNTEELFDKLEEYANLYELPLNIINREQAITSSLRHDIQFITQKLDFESTETEIKINHGFFEYQETLQISAINNITDHENQSQF